MRDPEITSLEPARDARIGEPVELSDAELECVVGGLARPWTEREEDEWLEPAPNLV